MKYMAADKQENKNKIGILGGTFDPAHRGHLSISKEAKKRFGIDKIIWAVTKKNPFKGKSSLSLDKRIKYAKKITQNNLFIKVKYFEDKIKSNRTIDLIKNNHEVNFFVAGKPDFGNKSSINKNEFNALCDNNNLTYLGEIDIYSELYKYDILIQPSYHEGFSRVLLEKDSTCSLCPNLLYD